MLELRIRFVTVFGCLAHARRDPPALELVHEGEPVPIPGRLLYEDVKLLFGFPLFSTLIGPVARSRSALPPAGGTMTPARMLSWWLSCSPFMTSAPMAARKRPAPALASIHDRSITRMSERANGIGLSGGFSPSWGNFLVWSATPN